MTAQRIEQDHGAPADPAPVAAHRFFPRAMLQPWGLCRDCGLAQAAHERTAVVYEVKRPVSVPAPEHIGPGGSYHF